MQKEFQECDTSNIHKTLNIKSKALLRIFITTVAFFRTINTIDRNTIKIKKNTYFGQI